MKIRQPQTKRKTFKLKYKIIKKVSQHHRRLRKEARKAEKAGVVRKKTRKDPGIPNNWPYKQEELLALQRRQEKRDKELAQKKKQAHDKVQAERKEALQDAKEARAAKMESKVEKRIAEREAAERKALKKLISEAQVLLEVVDARDPMACRSLQMEHRLLGKGKPVVILLNKVESVPKKAVAAWLRYFADRGCLALAYEKAGRAGASMVVRLLKALAAVAKTTTAPGSNSPSSKESLTFGVFGPKGVSKRMVLDGLRKFAEKPGHGGSGPLSLMPLKAEAAGMIMADRAGRLEDGTSMRKGMDAASALGHRTCELLRGATNVTQIETPKEAVAGFLSRASKESLMRRFALPDFADPEDFLKVFAEDKGWKSRRGKPLEPERIAEKFLTELGDQTQGGFRYACAPPTTEQELIAEKNLWAKIPGGPGLLTNDAIRPILEEHYAAFSGAVEAPSSPPHVEMASIVLDFEGAAKGAEHEPEDEDESGDEETDTEEAEESSEEDDDDDEEDDEDDEDDEDENEEEDEEDMDDSDEEDDDMS